MSAGAPLATFPRDVVAAGLRQVLGRARFERMREAMGPDARVTPWTELVDAGRDVYARQMEWLLPVLLPMVTAPFVVGARDLLDGRLGNFCLAPAGAFECTRAPHADGVHACGDGDFVVAVWRAVL